MNMYEWLRAFAEALGVDPPNDDEINHLLDLAATAAHASVRQAAPLSCWLVAHAGKPLDEALAIAAALAERKDAPGT